jgi:hypothetical protein
LGLVGERLGWQYAGEGWASREVVAQEEEGELFEEQKVEEIGELEAEYLIVSSIRFPTPSILYKMTNGPILEGCRNEL